MNPAPTRAQNNDYNGNFSKGAKMSVSGSTAAVGNDPEGIDERRDNSAFRGSTAQPIRKGQKHKFFDESVNHPAIPKSAMKDVTQEAQAVPSVGGVSPDLIGNNNP